MGLELVIDERYVVKADKYNFVLWKLEDVKDKETGEIKQKWKDIAFYSQLSFALKRYASEKIKEENKLNIKDLVVKLKELEKHIEKVVKKENVVLYIKEDKDKEAVEL